MRPIWRFAEFCGGSEYLIYQVDTKVRYTAQKPTRRRKYIYKKKKKKRKKKKEKTAVCLDPRAFKKIESVYQFVSRCFNYIEATDLSTVKFAVNEARRHCRSVVTVSKVLLSLHAMPRHVKLFLLCLLAQSLSFLNSFYKPTCYENFYTHTCVRVCACVSMSTFHVSQWFAEIKIFFFFFQCFSNNRCTRKIIKRDCRYPRQCWLRIFLYLHKNKHNLHLYNKL